jgi:hypothetical protein
VQFDPGTRSSEYAGQYYNNAATFGASTGVAVTAGSTTANIDATLAPAGHITGRVTNPSGTGIQDIQVTVYDSSGDGTMDTWVNISTDELGNYDASGLPTGTYRVQFDDPDNGTYLGEFYNNATTFALAANVPVTAGTTIPNINATLAYIVAPSTPQTVWRFRNLRNGFYLWSADPSEKATIINTLSGTWFYEGPAYNINTSNPLNSSPLWRFRNIRGGFYLYTADPGEKATIINTLGGTWTYEGPAYNVSMSSSGAPVWRFRNLHDGTYLYSADPNEKNTIVATLGWTWFLEGVAYYIAP